MLFQRDSTLRPNSSRPQRILRRSLAVIALGMVSLAWGRVPAVQMPLAQGLESKEVFKPYRVVISAFSPEIIGLVLFHLSANAGAGSSIDRVDVQALPSGNHELSFVLNAPSDLGLAALGACTELTGASVRSIRAEMPLEARSSAPKANIQLAACNIDILDLITDIGRKGGANIIVGPGVKGTLTVAIDSVPWRHALELSVQALGFRITEERGGVLRIQVPESPAD